MRSKALFYFWLLMLLLCFSAIAAEQPRSPISVKAEVDKGIITIGDPVLYTITIRHAPDVTILSSIPPPDPQIFKIKKIDEFKKDEDGMIVEGRKMTLTAFKLGEYILDPIKIDYRIGTQDLQSIETDRLFITVKSVAGDKPPTDIRGIKAVVAIPSHILKILLWILACIALAVIGAVVYQRLKTKGLQELIPERPLTNEEWALRELEQLFDSDLLRRGKVKEYYLKLSEILRMYFEKRFSIQAVELTTDETLRTLKKNEISGDLLSLIAEVLEAADLVKFAKWRPEPPQIILLNQKSKQIVELARPAEVVQNAV